MVGDEQQNANVCEFHSLLTSYDIIRLQNLTSADRKVSLPEPQVYHVPGLSLYFHQFEGPVPPTDAIIFMASAQSALEAQIQLHGRSAEVSNGANWQFDALGIQLKFRGIHPGGSHEEVLTWGDLELVINGLDAFFPLDDLAYFTPQWFQARFGISSWWHGYERGIGIGIFRQLPLSTVEVQDS